MVLSLYWSLELVLFFAEAFVTPPMASAALKFVEGLC
jgi:hypothetical protein